MLVFSFSTWSADIDTLKKACELDDNSDCFNLGVSYEDGKGVK